MYEKYENEPAPWERELLAVEMPEPEPEPEDPARYW